MAKIPNVSIVSFIGVYGSKFTKFCTLVEHHGAVYRESLRGVTAENLERIAKKPGIFALVHAKARTVFTSGVKGQGRTYNCRPLSYGSRTVLSVQKFASVPEL